LLETRLGEAASLFPAEDNQATMLRLALFFLLIALLAGVSGFILTGELAFEAGKVLFLVFLVFAAVVPFLGLRRGSLE
jgi:uncharacterized membrane protein YtjA (UPF0391 family)